eukprot:TRINITY_DN2488_c0_g1_i1.p1 TRINITY_DN2488_c0_g1~~TRINITY_DN2488_c0_g1_i1.p1  ORF type:complete len:416 (+),score=161.93 TRINITY_DN2488_c0_g1_i1:27-1274(+)
MVDTQLLELFEGLFKRLDTLENRLSALEGGKVVQQEKEEEEVFSTPYDDVLKKYYEEVVPAWKKCSEFAGKSILVLEPHLVGLKVAFDTVAKYQDPLDINVTRKALAVLVEAHNAFKFSVRRGDPNFDLCLALEGMKNVLAFPFYQGRMVKYLDETIPAVEFDGDRVLMEGKAEEKESFRALLKFLRALREFAEENHGEKFKWNRKAPKKFTEEDAILTAPSKDESKKEEKIATKKEEPKKPEPKVQKKVEEKKEPFAGKTAQGTYLIENYQGGTVELEIEGGKGVYFPVNIKNCNKTLVKLTGKAANFFVFNCKNTNIVFEKSISAFEMINCQKCKIFRGDSPDYALENCRQITITIKEDLSEKFVLVATSSIDTNVVVEKEDDYYELAVPYQFETKIVDGKLVTAPFEHCHEG